MKTKFILSTLPVWVYLTEDQAQKEYISYIELCQFVHSKINRESSIGMFLPFCDWLLFMEYKIL